MPVFSTEIKKILVPLDGSPFAEHALPMACSLAEKYDAQIVLLRVVEPLPGTEYVTYPEALQLLSRLSKHLVFEAEEYLVAQQRELNRAGCRVKTTIREGVAAESIIEAVTSEGIDMVVMSTHGRGGLSRWTAGSVADKVMRYCQCPIVLIRQGAT
jgi:nucleotide-binding universal stress UspA family protein